MSSKQDSKNNKKNMPVAKKQTEEKVSKVQQQTPQKHKDAKPEQKSEKKPHAKRLELESVLNTPLMSTLEHFADEELMELYRKMKEAHDLIHTRTLLLPRELRLTEAEREYLQMASEELKSVENGVVEEDDEEEDEEDDELLGMSDDDISNDDEEEDENIKKWMGLFKKRLVLNFIDVQEKSAEDEMIDDYDQFDDEDDGMLDDEAEESEESEEQQSKKKSSKQQKSKDEDSNDEEDEEDEEDGEEGDDDEDDGMAQSRQIFASFSLLGADGKPAATHIELECHDIYTANGFEGEHKLIWEEDPIFTLNVQDGDIVDPEGPSLQELQDQLEADEQDEEEGGLMMDDDEFLAGSIPNTWDADVADSLKSRAGFPEEISPLQFVVLMTRVMSRIIRNAAHPPGPAPADGLLPYMIVELSEKIAEEEEEDNADEMELDESSEEAKPQKKEQKKEQSKDQKKEQHKDQKKDQNKDQNKQKQQQKEAPKANKQQEQPKKSDHKPQQQQGNKQNNKPQHDNKKPQHNNNDKKQHNNNDKKRNEPTGGHSPNNKHQNNQNKKHKSK